MPSPEPKPGEAGWLYRVLEPYYSRECALASKRGLSFAVRALVFPHSLDWPTVVYTLAFLSPPRASSR